MSSARRSSSSSSKEGRSSKAKARLSGAADETTTTTTTITFCVPHPPNPAVDPILCSFPGGLPGALVEDANTVSSKTQLPYFRIGSKQGVGHHKVVKGQDHACEYTATLSSPKRSSASRPTQMCIAIYDKQTNRVTLQPTADQGFVYAMAQSVPRYHNRKNNQQAAATDVEEPTMTAAESRKALFGDFGSAKKRKVMRSQEANRVNVESVVGAGNMDSILQGMSESNRQAVVTAANGDGTPAMTAADQATLTWRKQFLPEYNQNADAASKVYNAKKIAGAAAWNRLWNRVSKCLEQENVLAAILEGPPKPNATPTTEQGGNDDGATEQRRSKDVWYPSVVRLIKMLAPKGEAVKQQLVCAVLLNHFLHLYVQLHKKRYISAIEPDRPRFFGTPTDVGQRWVERFTTPMAGRDGEMGHVMSKANKDSCCVHLFLLLLMAEGGHRMRSDSIQDLADDLQMDAKDASHLLRLAGCTVARKSTRETCAVLAVPLKFPSLKKSKR